MKNVLTALLLLCSLSACAAHTETTEPTLGFPLRQRSVVPFKEPIQEIAVARTWIAVATPTHITAIDLNTHRVLWTAGFPVIPYDDGMLVFEDTVVAASTDQVWLFTREGQHRTLRVDSQVQQITRLVAAYPQFLYVLGGQEWSLEAYDLSSGNVRWNYRVGRGGASNAYLDESKNILYVSGHSIMAINNQTGSPLWMIPTDTMISVLARDVIYEYDSLGRDDAYHVAAFRVSDHEQVWSKSYEFPPASGINQLRVFGDKLLLCGSRLIALDTSDGHQVWQVAAGDTFFACPAEFNGVLYGKTGTTRTVYAIAPSNGAVLGKALSGPYPLTVGADTNGIYGWDHGVVFSTGNQLVIFTSP